MTTLKRLAATALSAAVIAAPVLTVTSADAASGDQADRAAAKKFATISKSYGGQQQACKILLPNGKQYKVFTRVVTGRQSFGVGLMVMLDGEVVRRVQTPLTKPRRTSKVVSLKFPKGATEYELVASQFEGQSGGGGPVRVKKIRNC